MKLLFDFFPLVLFFGAYKLYDIFVATLVAMAASLAQVIWVRVRHQRFETTHLVTLFVILLFGGMTLRLMLVAVCSVAVLKLTAVDTKGYIVALVGAYLFFLLLEVLYVLKYKAEKGEKG